MKLKKAVVSSVSKSVKLDTKKLVQNYILDMSFSDGKKSDVVIYLLDKKNLKSALSSSFGMALKSEINCNDFKIENKKIADLGYISGKKVIVVGIGEKDGNSNDNNKKRKANEKDDILNSTLEMQKIGALMSSVIPANKNICLCISNKFCSIEDKMLVEMYFGLCQKYYNFTKYITDSERLKKEKKISNVILEAKDKKAEKSSEITKLIKDRQAKLEGIFLTRTLVNEPANVIYPETFAEEIEKNASGIKNIKIKVLTKKELQKLGMNLLLGVAQGSEKEPRVVIVEYNGNKSKKDYDIALVGKGVTFDSGGLSLKPESYMCGMKNDMAGSATVISTILSLAKCGAKVNAVALGGMVENMPSGTAQRVDDVVRSMSGKTVEIISTDAEGRLVLADVLYYAQTTYKPKYMIDVATLTGAIMIALGQERAGIFSNSDELAMKIKKSGDDTGDNCWIMPMGKEYHEPMKSNIADLRNCSSTRYAGSATAAAFLENFIGDNKNWAHIDIAGVDTATKNNVFGRSGIATGFGIKLLTDFIEKNIEK